jgi:hypothetical protein
VSDPACASCHTTFEPPWLCVRTENGSPIDATGTLSGTDVDGAFDGAAELGLRLAGSDQVAACAVDHYLRFALGRALDETAEACLAEEIRSAFEARDRGFAELATALATSPTFWHRREGN